MDKRWVSAIVTNVEVVPTFLFPFWQRFVNGSDNDWKPVLFDEAKNAV
jgi:hypothetical protein